MTESGAAGQLPDDDQALKKRLLMRVGGAAMVMAGLVAGLLAFDALTVKPEKAVAEKVAVKPAEPEKEAVAEKPAEPATAEPSQAPETVVPPPPVVAAVPEESAAPVNPPPAASERPLTLPAKPHMALARPTAPVMILPNPAPAASAPAARSVPAPKGEAVRGGGSGGPEPLHPAASRPAEAPLGQALAAAKRFLVQVGVFSSLNNAEELRAKLELAGIPAQIEARVQVGPFASREEAEQARAKLKELGIEPGMVMAARK